MTDTELLEASSAGKVEAFATLVHRYQSLVCAVSFSATGDQALSEDVAQDTFVAAWRSLDDLRETSKLRSWLCGIARNLRLKALRRVGREVPGEVEIQAALHGVENTSQSPLDAALDKEAQQLVWMALAAVPETYREPLVLFYREDKSTQQVAEILGLSDNAVQQRLSRGRQHLKQSVTGIVETTLSRTKPAKSFAAGVIAVISVGLPASAEAASTSANGSGVTAELVAKGILSMKKLLAIGALALAMLTMGVGTYLLLRDAGKTTVNASTQEPPKAEPIHAAWSRDLQLRPKRSVLALSDDGGEAEQQGVHLAYELTVAAPTLVSVNLSGGPSSVTTFRDPAPPPEFERHVQGRVLDSKGDPVEGAIVLVGSRLHQQWGSLIGEQGAISDHKGAFRVPVHSKSALDAIAIHQEAGWSFTKAIPEGEGDSVVELTIAASGSLAGRVMRGGEPEVGALSLRSADNTLALSLESDSDGRFHYPMLPPGSYQLRAGLSQEIAEGASKQVEFDIEIMSGETVTHDIELPVGLLLAVRAIPNNEAIRIVEYTLLRGKHQPKTDDSLKALVKTPAGEGHRYRLYGGMHKDHLMQFHDLEGGMVTVCVSIGESLDEVLGFRCKSIELDASSSVEEATFEFDR